MVIDKMKYSQLTFLILAENIRRIKVGYAFYFREADGGSIHGKIKDVGNHIRQFLKACILTSYQST